MANSFEFFMRRVKRVDVGSRAAMVALAGVMMIAPCEAAFLDQIQGKVLVDTGAGFKPVTGAIVVKPGDRIMAQADGSATVKYSGNCVAEVKAGAVVSVVGEGTCVSSRQVTTNASMNDGASGVGNGGAGVVDPGVVDPGVVDPGATGGFGAGGAGLSPLAIGAVVAGAGGLIYLATKKAAASSP